MIPAGRRRKNISHSLIWLLRQAVRGIGHGLPKSVALAGNNLIVDCDPHCGGSGTADSVRMRIPPANAKTAMRNW